MVASFLLAALSCKCTDTIVLVVGASARSCGYMPRAILTLKCKLTFEPACELSKIKGVAQLLMKDEFG